MQPVGLTQKSDGELMVIHRCTCCGKISCNRIAGDDNTYAITCLLETPGSLNRDILAVLSVHGIRLLTMNDIETVSQNLYGNNF